MTRRTAITTPLGTAARNGIMLVSHYRHLEHEDGGGHPWRLPPAQPFPDLRTLLAKPL